MGYFVTANNCCIVWHFIFMFWFFFQFKRKQRTHEFSWSKNFSSIFVAYRCHWGILPDWIKKCWLIHIRPHMYFLWRQILAEKGGFKKQRGNTDNIETMKHLTAAERLNRDIKRIKEYESCHVTCKSSQNCNLRPNFRYKYRSRYRNILTNKKCLNGNM